MAIELVRIRTAQQYPMLMPTLFPGDLATREKPYVTLTSMWTAFNDLKHNMSPAIDGDVFASAPRTSSPHAPPTIAVPAASTAVSQRHYGRPTRPPHPVSNVSHAHSRRDPFRVDYACGPLVTKIMTLSTLSPITCSTQTCPCGRSFSLRTPVGKLVYSIAAVVVIAVRRTTVFVGVPLPSRTFFPSSARNLPHMTTMGPYSNRGKKTCVSGAVVTRTASTKVMADVVPLGITTAIPTTKVTVIFTKVIVTGPLHGRTSPQLRLNL